MPSVYHETDFFAGLPAMFVNHHFEARLTLRRALSKT